VTPGIEAQAGLLLLAKKKTRPFRLLLDGSFASDMFFDHRHYHNTFSTSV
jgi:hypothetical protein